MRFDPGAADNPAVMPALRGRAGTIQGTEMKTLTPIAVIGGPCDAGIGPVVTGASLVEQTGRKRLSEFRQYGPSPQNQCAARIKYDHYLLPKLILVGRQLERRAPPDREQCTFGDGLGLSISGGFDQRWRTSERAVSVQ